uniref:Uncharacterized protein n=1 Tax=Arundo donax TaxID=35708 RepID=A0A0A9HGD8_ARUDO
MPAASGLVYLLLKHQQILAFSLNLSSLTLHDIEKYCYMKEHNER